MPPPLTPFPWIDVVVILALMLVNAAFAMSELAIVSSRRPRLEALARHGHKGARVAIELASDPGKFLSTVQTGITLTAVFAGAFSDEPQLVRVGRRITVEGGSDLSVEPRAASALQP